MPFPQDSDSVEFRLSTAGAQDLTIKREDGEESPVILAGHAAMFNSLSDELSPWPDILSFREKIDPGAFKDVLTNDVRSLFNHDPNLILGRTTNKTLFLREDNIGLFTQTVLPDTQVARDLATSVSRGDVNQMSFAFIIKEDTIEIRETDEIDYVTRTIHLMEELRDTSIVTYPAYPQTDVVIKNSAQTAIERLASRINEKRGTPKLDATRGKLALVIRKGKFI